MAAPTTAGGEGEGSGGLRERKMNITTGEGRNH